MYSHEEILNDIKTGHQFMSLSPSKAVCGQDIGLHRNASDVLAC